MHPQSDGSPKEQLSGGDLKRGGYTDSHTQPKFIISVELYPGLQAPFCHLKYKNAFYLILAKMLSNNKKMHLKVNQDCLLFTTHLLV